MNLKVVELWNKVPQLVDAYESANAAYKSAKRSLIDAENALSAAKIRLAGVLISKNAKDGETFNVWLPQGLLTVVARPNISDECEVMWLVKDESRSRTVNVETPTEKET